MAVYQQRVNGNRHTKEKEIVEQERRTSTTETVGLLRALKACMR